MRILHFTFRNDNHNETKVPEAQINKRIIKEWKTKIDLNGNT